MDDGRLLDMLLPLSVVHATAFVARLQLETGSTAPSIYMVPLALASRTLLDLGVGRSSAHELGRGHVRSTRHPARRFAEAVLDV